MEKNFLKFNMEDFKAATSKKDISIKDTIKENGVLYIIFNGNLISHIRVSIEYLINENTDLKIYYQNNKEITYTWSGKLNYVDLIEFIVKHITSKVNVVSN